ncbi:5-formyltetrahydrofolate cyclo-ligase [Clostridium chauvoei]|uniref:5-formyltetrahydrofolate cyclo-ligase n=2 Tax=Clostridium chauvoei TaxID=46867 RepID=A0A1U6IWJ5_9CLOT|nr:5-formyltetrahydrofolate cyclo-ligase [Clostridium chauvoei]SLK12389.1 Putative=5-formyltetrahydrofolate cyclo-ligase [Clostridium chauvoei JF4335]
MSKKELRDKVLLIRDNLNAKEKIEKDNNILSKLLNTELYKNSTNIFTYISYGSEVDTKELINKSLKNGKKIFVPKTIKESREMKAINITSLENLTKDKYGILEPISFDKNIDKNKLDLIIMPGSVFDSNGNRIGYGGGYYDRYLLDIYKENNKVALAYDFQVKDNLLVDEHDIKVDYIITEKRLIKVK